MLNSNLLNAYRNEIFPQIIKRESANICLMFADSYIYLSLLEYHVLCAEHADQRVNERTGRRYAELLGRAQLVACALDVEHHAGAAGGLPEERLNHLNGAGRRQAQVERIAGENRFRLCGCRRLRCNPSPGHVFHFSVSGQRLYGIQQELGILVLADGQPACGDDRR